MLLKDYLIEENLSERAFASLVKISHVHLNHVISGTRGASSKLMKRIKEATNGRVTYEDLIENRDAKE